jgi:type I restriction enzyme S subunit
MSEWKKVRLGDLCSRVCSGGTPKSTCSSYYDGGTIPWLNTKEVHSNRIYATERKITELGLANSAAKWISANTVIIAMYGATAGNVAQTRIPLTTNQACCNLEIDSKFADADFIFYVMRNKYDALYLLANGAAQQNLNAQVIKDFEIPLPPLPTQRKIAAVLGALDDKIENNRKICANLEAQAQAIFKSWFVDFEPFGGKMPQGWKMGKLGDVADITMGQSPDGKSLNDVGDGITFFQGRAEFGNRFPTKRLSTTEPNRMAKSGDVLLSVRAPVGDLNIALEDCCIGRGLAAIRSKAGSQSFIYCLLKALKPAFDLYEGAGTIFGSINKDSLHGLDVVVPDSGWIEKFESVVSSHDRMYRERELESRALAAMRDALLPKLMSGEIDVEKVKVA